MLATIRRLAPTAVLAAGLAFAGASAAVTITFQATDLPDVNVGEDLWQYSYTVTGSFVPLGGFQIFFSPPSYSKLEDPPPVVNGDWLTSVIEPDTVLMADGFYKATALVLNPSLADVFTLSFVWSGPGEPDKQLFEVFDETFDILESGTTQPPGAQQVPLPGTLALIAGGLLGLRLGRALSRQ